MTSVPWLHIDAVQACYGPVTALQDFSLHMAAGDLLMIVGPNGAGKSTLMKCLSGRLRPRAGRILLQGQDLVGCPPEAIAARGISMVPEGRQVFGGLTVRENLMVGTGLRRDRSGIRRDLEALLDLFPALQSRLQDNAALLSGGQQQMLVIARALMTAPTLLAIDEPSLGLAPNITDAVYDALCQWRRARGTTLLIVEQSTARAIQLDSRMVMIREGRCVLAGHARQFPSHTLERAYFGLEEDAA